MSTSLHPIARDFIEDLGNTTQALGLGRVVGQIYAYLYFSPDPRSLSDMQHTLGISKGGASMAVRQLAQWNAVRKVWVKGDRRDYYEANGWFGGIIRRALVESIGQRLTSFASLLDAAERRLDTDASAGDDSPFVRARVGELQDFRRKADRTLNNPIVRHLLDMPH